MGVEIKKIKDWLKEQVDERQFNFIHGNWVKRLSDGETFKVGERVLTNTPETPLCVIGQFFDDEIHVWLDIIGSKKFFMIPIDKIKSISPNLSYKKT